MDTNLAYILPKYHVVQQHKSQHDPVKHMNLTISQHFINIQHISSQFAGARHAVTGTSGSPLSVQSTRQSNG